MTIDSFSMSSVDQQQQQQQQHAESAFLLIENGNAFQSCKNWWAASDSFVRATHILTHLAADAAGQESAEQKRISQLYDTKRYEYLGRARDCFVKALTSEAERDQERRNEMVDTLHDARVLETDLLCATISTEEINKRLNTFAGLFAKSNIKVKYEVGNGEDVMGEGNTPKDVDEDGETTEKSIEERLKDLNRSLPAGLKSSTQRMVDIDKGMRRLGLTSFTEQKREEVVEELDEDEQVEQILNQAKDEVLFEKNTEQDGKVQSTVDGKDSDRNEESDNESSDSDDTDLDRRILKVGSRKAAKEQIVQAQRKLAKIVALIDSKPDKYDGEFDDESETDQSEANIELERQILMDAKKFLKKALVAWSDL